MAPFLVITLLLALGAGIVAWYVTGSAFRQPPLLAPRKRRSGPVRPASPVVGDVIASAEPEPFVRPADPFAHAPSPTKREQSE